MKRFLLIIVACCMLLAATAVPAVADQNLAVTSGEPEAIYGLVMVPVASVAESLGGTASWDEQAGAATIKTATSTIVLTVEESVALVDGKRVGLSAPVTMKDGRVYAPVTMLLPFFGQGQTVKSAAAKDPVALALLAWSWNRLPENADMHMTEQMKVTVKDGKELDAWMSEQTEVSSHVRQGDALSFINNVSAETSRDGTEVESRDSRRIWADRGVNAYTQYDGGRWIKGRKSPPSPAAFDKLLLFLPDTARQLSTLSEVRMGDVTVVDGRPLQELIIKYDRKYITNLLGTGLEKELAETGGKDGIAVQGLEFRVQVDPWRGHIRTIKGDMALAATLSRPDTKELAQATIDLQVNLVVTPADKPIVWPQDMPN